MGTRAKGYNRRAFMGSAALGAAGLAGLPAIAAAGRDGDGRAGVTGLPRRGQFVIRRAHVLTMDPALGDLAGADVHVRDGRIVAVGRSLRAGGEEIDGRGTIVLPGLVDTHWHLWTTLYRSMSSTSPRYGYFALNLRNGAHTEPDDLYHGARLGLADALSSGVTTVHDWSHNLRSPAHADANLRAHVEVGLRGRFSYGSPQGHPADQTIDLVDFERVHREWFASGRAGLLRLGLAGRPPGDAPGGTGPNVYRTEYETARRLGLPVSYHANSNRAQGAAAMVQLLGDEGMLGPDTQVIHALYLTQQERRLLADTRTAVSVSPWSELLIGYGVTPIRDLEADGALLNLSVDTMPLTGTADMFSVMRLTLGLARGQAEQELATPARRVLEMATIDGARGLGLGDVIGSLTPGKRADLIMVRARDVNMAPFTDAVNMIVLAAGPQNVDTVVVDGRILKRHGGLTALDPQEVVRETSGALVGLMARVGAAPRARSHEEREVGCCG